MNFVDGEKHFPTLVFPCNAISLPFFGQYCNQFFNVCHLEEFPISWSIDFGAYLSTHNCSCGGVIDVICEEDAVATKLETPVGFV